MDGVCPEARTVNGERSRLLVDDHNGREANKAAWGEWLSAEWDWDWWVTLTYDAKKFRSGSADRSNVGRKICATATATNIPKTARQQSHVITHHSSFNIGHVLIAGRAVGPAGSTGRYYP